MNDIMIRDMKNNLTSDNLSKILYLLLLSINYWLCLVV